MNPIQSLKQNLLREREARAAQAESPQRTALKLLAGFFVLMLLFTFLSRSANAMTIAEVKTETPSAGVLTHRVEADGKVEAAAQQSLFLPQGAPIDMVKTEAGARVAAGSPLFTLRREETDLLIRRLENELAALRLEQTTARADDTPLEGAQRELEQLLQDQGLAAGRAQESVDRAQREWNEAHRTYQRLYEQYEDYLDDSYQSWRNSPNDADYDALKPDWEDSERRTAWIATAKMARAEMDAARRDILAREDALQSAIRADTAEKLENERRLAERRQAVADAAEKHTETGAEAAVKRNELALSLSEKEKDLNSLNALRAAGYVLESPVNGVVLKLAGESGGISSGGEAVALSADSAGYQVTALVTKRQMEWLAAGDMAALRLTMDGRRQEVKAALSSIGLGEPDSNGDERYRLTFALPEGSYLAGENASLALETPSAQYWSLLPLTALRTEGGQDCVYLLEKADTALGTETVARRVPVTILDRDAARMALDAGFAGDAEIITESSRSLSDGGRIRTTENA